MKNNVYQILKFKTATLLTFFFLASLPFYTSAQTFNETLGTGAGVNISSGDFNVIIGDSAGVNLTSGSRNTLLGYQAGKNITTSEGVFIGYLAGNSNTTGFDNTFVGYEAGRLTTTGGDNTFFGAESGENNTTGYDNTFVGEESGANNTTGYENTLIGEDAGFSLTTGYKNTFIGNESGGYGDGTGYKNTAVGSESMSDVDGHRNTALGDSAGIDIGDGNYNTMLGQASGASTEYADFNTFVGWFAGWDNNRTNSTTNANRNTYLGAKTGWTNREGEDNVGIGAFANFNTTSRSRCTFMGAYSDADNNDVIAIGYDARNAGQYAISMGNLAHVQSATGGILLGYNSDMSSNANYSVGIGYLANITNTSAVGIGRQIVIQGDSSIGIGALDSVTGARSVVIGSSSTVTGNNSIAIGSDVRLTANNEVYIGNTSTQNIGGVVNWTATSDGRVKTGVRENVPGLDFITQLRPVTYNLDATEMAKLQGWTAPEKLSLQNTRYSGFIAQEVQETAKGLDYDFSGVKVPQNDNELYGLKYAEFVVPLVKAVQELDAKISSMEQLFASDTKMSKRKRNRAQIAMLEYEITLLKEQNKLLAALAEQDEFMVKNK